MIMKSIKAYARFLELFCVVAVLPIAIITPFLKWFGRDIPAYKTISDYIQSINLNTGDVCHMQIVKISYLPIVTRILGLIVDGVSVGLFVYGCLYFIRVLRCYRRGEIFSDATLDSFKKLSRAAFAWTLYNPINYTLLTLITTIHNPVGKRILAFSIGSQDVMNIFILGVFYTLTSLMHEGYMLKKEQDLTI
jgi:hypothetical protein